MALLHTTHGELEESSLSRTVGFEDRPSEFVIWVEWKMAAHDANCPHCLDQTNPRPAADGSVLVRRDAHVVLKQGSVIADALVGGVG